MAWTKGQVERLIYLVSERPYLFDPRNSLYKNKGKRMVGMQEIADEMKPIRPDITDNDVKKKWYSMRTNYFSEKRKVAKSKKSGAGVDSLYTPSLYYYKDMGFLDEYTSPRESTSTLDDVAEDGPGLEEDISVFDDIEFEGEITPDASVLDIVFVEEEARSSSTTPYAGTSDPKPTPGPSGLGRKRKAKDPLEDVSSAMRSASQVLGSLTQKVGIREDTETIFGKLVTSKLHSISNEAKKKKIMYEINKVFYDNDE